MKKIFSIILVLAMVLSMATVANASSELVHTGAWGTAVVDGTKDAAYDNALVLSVDQKGVNAGGDKLDTPAATAYYLNDGTSIYVYIEIVDANLDNSNANTYEQDSVELFWMSDNSRQQTRVHFDGRLDGSELTAYAATVTDNGFVVEAQYPITDVIDGAIDTCLQINCCTDGKRDYCAFITDNADGDNAWQRNNRESTYDSWWVLTLATEPVAEEPAVEEPAVEEPAVEEPAVEEPKEEAPAETGLALAVVPAVIALAAAVISKRR